MASAVVDAVFGSYDIHNAQRWRDDDLHHRSQEVQWHIDDVQRQHAWRAVDLEREKRLRKLENEKRMTDAHSEQVSAISNLSALLGGFAVVAMVELNLPPNMNQGLLICFGVVTAIVVVLMIICMVMCTLLLLAVTRYSAHELEADIRAIAKDDLDDASPFYSWWLAKCEYDWIRAYRCFRFGISLFLVDVALVSWIQFHESIITSILVSIISLLGFLYWQLHMTSKWRHLMKFPEPSSIPTGCNLSSPAPHLKSKDRQTSYHQALEEALRTESREDTPIRRVE